MRGYSLRESENPNLLVVYCHQCRQEISVDKRLSKNLSPPASMAWPKDQGPPSDQSLLWDRLISEHEPKCDP